MHAVNLEAAEDGFLAFSWENLSPRDRIRVLADSPSTVWIFGAGASHHYALNTRGVRVPLANGFFEAFNQLPTSKGFHAHVGPLISYLSHSRGVGPDKVSQWTENIEEFMTSVEHALNELKENRKQGWGKEEFAEAARLAQVFNNMTFILANVINESQNGPSTSAYQELLKFCGPRDKFITFNWDTLLDRALTDAGGWTPNNGYGFSFSSILDSTWKPAIEPSPVFSTEWKLLKLHGSTNWLVPYTGFRLDTFDYEPIFSVSDKVFLFWQSTLGYETHRGRWLRPHMLRLLSSQSPS